MYFNTETMAIINATLIIFNIIFTYYVYRNTIAVMEKFKVKVKTKSVKENLIEKVEMLKRSKAKSYIPSKDLDNVMKGGVVDFFD